MNSNSNLIRGYNLFDYILLIFLGLFALSIIYPFWNVILVSVVPMQVYMRSPFMLIPPEIIWDNYLFVFRSRLIWSGFGNSVFVTIVGTAYNMLLTVLCAYALTKPFPGRKFIRFYIIFTLYFSGGIIPYFLLMQNFGLMNSIWVLILPSGFVVLWMIILSSYFSSIPASLEESARMDGANDFVILFRIILPLSLPFLATFSLFYAVDRWNEWFHGLLFIRTATRQPLQMVLRQIIMDAQFINQQIVPGVMRPDVSTESIRMAAIVVTMFPLMSLYPFLQKYFLTGLVLGAVKE